MDKPWTLNLPLQGVNAHLIPSIGLGLGIFGMNALDLSLAFSNLISMDAEPTFNVTCPVDLSLSRTHSFALQANMGLLSYVHTFWESEKIALPCPFCIRCDLSKPIK